MGTEGNLHIPLRTAVVDHLLELVDKDDQGTVDKISCDDFLGVPLQ